MFLKHTNGQQLVSTLLIHQQQIQASRIVYTEFQMPAKIITGFWFHSQRHSVFCSIQYMLNAVNSMIVNHQDYSPFPCYAWDIFLWNTGLYVLNLFSVENFSEINMSHPVVNPGLEVSSCRNVTLLNLPNNSITLLRYFNNTVIAMMTMEYHHKTKQNNKHFFKLLWR